MIYDFRCENCDSTFEVVRHVRERDIAEECDCGGVASRIFSFRGAVGVGTFKAGYYPSFGKNIGTQDQLRDTLAKHEGETGQKLYEVGNDKMSNVKVKKKQADMNEAKRMLYREMRKNG